MIAVLRAGNRWYRGRSGELHCDIWERAGRPPKPEFGFIRGDGVVWRPVTPGQAYRMANPDRRLKP